jgi:hypothetical protein
VVNCFLLYVFTYLVPCCDVCYEFRIITVFDSSLPKLCVGGSCLVYVVCIALRVVVSKTTI